ncbi:MAG: hypothetical protein NW216_02895 [Hyphomicrobium sp.]|nr:hypothetical protein [Hyphomicrobium sp.]
MYNRPLVPPDFLVPDRLDCGTFHLRMLAIGDFEKDYAAVMASAERLTGLLDPDSPWPAGLTLEEDMIDLAWHQREFTLRHSFAYTVMSNDGIDCLGCCYIFPSNVPAYDATAFYWVREGSDALERDRDLGNVLRNWLKDVWPFRAVAFPGRDITWPVWRRHEALAAETI